MNWLDIVLAIILAASVIEGFRKGLARTATGLGALIFGLLCAFWFHGTLAAHFTFMDSRNAANLVAFFVIFLAFLLVGALIGALIARLLKLVHLSWLDRLGGGVFGVIRGVLGGAIVVLAVMAFTARPGPGSVSHSRLAPYVIDTARVLTAAAPYEVKNAFRNSYEKVKQIWAGALKSGT